MGVNIQFQQKHQRVTLDDTGLISLVNEYLQQFRKSNGEPSISKVRAKLGWTSKQWKEFVKKAGKFLVMEYIPEFSVIQTPEAGDPERVSQSLAKRGIQTEDIERRVATAYGSLRKDLETLGLTEQEVEGCMAMQSFGENRFANAMEVISTCGFNTAVKLQTQQRMMEERMAFVRERIQEYGTMVSEERQMWVAEEQKLVRNYATLGKLLADIQMNWYQGSAQLALVKMRMRDDKVRDNPVSVGRTNGRDPNRPRFRPTVIDAEVETAPEPPPGEQAEG